MYIIPFFTIGVTPQIAISLFIISHLMFYRIFTFSLLSYAEQLSSLFITQNKWKQFSHAFSFNLNAISMNNTKTRLLHFFLKTWPHFANCSFSWAVLYSQCYQNSSLLICQALHIIKMPNVIKNQKLLHFSTCLNNICHEQ